MNCCGRERRSGAVTIDAEAAFLSFVHTFSNECRLRCSISALFQVKFLTFISMTVVAPQPQPPRPSARVLHNHAGFLFVSLAGDLIWEKSESAAVDGS